MKMYARILKLLNYGHIRSLPWKYTTQKSWAVPLWASVWAKQLKEFYKEFKNELTFVDSYHHSGRPLTTSTWDNIDREEDRRLFVSKLVMLKYREQLFGKL